MTLLYSPVIIFTCTNRIILKLFYSITYTMVFDNLLLDEKKMLLMIELLFIILGFFTAFVYLQLCKECCSVVLHLNLVIL